MPLSPLTLTNALLSLDQPAPLSLEASAEAWFSAWWKYAQEMSYWNPALLPVAEAAARTAFLGFIIPAMVPNPVPLTFFLGLESAMVAAWPAASLTPGTLIPAYAPIPIAPAAYVPGILANTLVSTVVPLGLASQFKDPPIMAIANAIAAWTPLSFVAFLPGSPPVPTPIV